MKWQVEEKRMKRGLVGTTLKVNQFLLYIESGRWDGQKVHAHIQTVETVDDESVCWKSRLFNEESLWAQTRALGTADIS